MTTNISQSFSADDIYKSAADFYNKKDKENLEQLFSKYLVSSFDTRLWKIYLQHTKNLGLKKTQMKEVFVFVLKHFENNYYAYEFIREYIEELDNSDESDSYKNEQIREIYHQFLKIPMENLTKLWSQYEAWEISINKLYARTFLENMQPFYLNALNVYQRLSSLIENNNYLQVLDVELENPLKLEKVKFNERILFVFNFFTGRTNKIDHLTILKTFYLPEALRLKNDEKEIKELANKSTLLSYWFSFIFKRDFFNLQVENNFTLTAINYLNFIIYKSGMEEFRKEFKRIKEAYVERMEYHLYLFVAETEFTIGNKEIGYETLIEANRIFEEGNVLNEKIVEILLKAGEVDKMTVFFKKMNKTARMYDLAIKNAFRTGNFIFYRELLQQKQDAIKNRELLEVVQQRKMIKAASGTQGVLNGILRTFEYSNLTLTTEKTNKNILRKVPSLPEEENIFKAVDLDKLVEIILRL